MMKKIYKPVITLVGYMAIILWLLDFKILEILDLKVMTGMLIGIIILSLASQKYSDSKGILGFNILMTSSVAVTLMFLKNTSQGILSIQSFMPAFYGCLYYLIYLIFDSLLTTSETIDNRFDMCDLTPREKMIAKALLQALSNKEIGDQFFIAESTVKKHLQSIYKKTQMNNRQDFIKHFTKTE